MPMSSRIEKSDFMLVDLSIANVFFMPGVFSVIRVFPLYRLSSFLFLNLLV